MPWRRECEASKGWQKRLQDKLAASAGVGLTAGALLSLAHNAPTGRYALGTAASCCIVVGSFGVLQELLCAARCQDTPLNSVAAGGAAGGLVYTLHYGQRALATGAVVGGLVGGAAHLFVDRVQPAQLFKRTLIELDLLDATPEEEAPAGASSGREQDAGGGGGSSSGDAGPSTAPPDDSNGWDQSGWRAWLPIRKMSDAEWEAYQARKKEEFRQRVAVAREGGLPAVVKEKEKERQLGGEGRGEG